MECPNQKKNQALCSCSYAGCSRHALCCECVHYHRAMGQVPGCFFTGPGEASYDRSIEKLIEDRGN